MSKKKRSDIYLQISIILTFLSVFFLAAMLSSAVQARRNTGGAVCIWIITLLFWCMWYRSAELKKEWWKWFIDNKEFCIVLFVCVFSRLFMCAKLQRWDGALYYGAIMDACRAFDFSFESFWNFFRFFGHPTLGYAFMMSIGEFLTPGKLMGVYFVHLILTAMAVYCIYILFQEYWTRVSGRRAAAYTFIVSSVPLFWGTFSYINPDYCIILFFLFMIYEESRDHYILMIFWLMILALTKETAMLVVAGYFLFKGMYYFFRGKYPLHIRVMNVLKNRCMQIALLGALGVICFFIKQKSIFNWGSVSIFDNFAGIENDTDALPYNAFAVNVDFIIHQVKLVFILSFAWIFTGMVIFAGIAGVIKKRKYPVRENWTENIVGMSGSFIILSLFLMIFTTVPLNRYHIFTAVTLVIMSLVLFENILKSRFIWNGKAEKGCLLLLSVLLTLQTFYSIDPVSNRLFLVGDTGKMKILSTGGSFEPYFDDVMVNNFQYTWMDDELEKMMQDTDFDADMLIITNKYNAKICSFGWDREAGKIGICSEFSPNMESVEMLSTRRMIKYIEEGDFYQSSILKRKKALIFFTKYDEEPEADLIALLSSYYDVGERKETDGKRGSIVYYGLTLRETESE